LFSHVNAGRMRLLQYHDPVNVSSESSTRGITDRSRSFSCKSGCLTWSEDGLQRQLRPNVAQLSILLTDIEGVFVAPEGSTVVRSDIRRKNQVVDSIICRMAGTTNDQAGRKVMPRPFRGGGYDRSEELTLLSLN